MTEYVALDLETTGFDPVSDRVIEVGAVAFTSEGVLESLQRLADPGRSVPSTVLRLTGIQLDELQGANSSQAALSELMEFIGGRQAVGHGAGLDLEFLAAAGLWETGTEIIDTLHLARILLPDAASHSLPLLAAELGLEQPRPHRALDDADATRQLFLRLRAEAAALEESLKQAMVALIAPYGWAIARFFAEALTGPSPSTAAGRAEAVASFRRGSMQGPPSDDPAFLASLLSPNGALAAALPDYELREPQLEMLLAVAQIFRRGGTLVVEAGTGTGKSLAYLIPAIARALARGERVVVSTNTHTLQEQLVSKDLPALRRWLPWDFQACLLKGRPNYVSLRRWRRYLAEPCLDVEELRFKLKVLVWLHQTQTGDRSELRLQGREEVFWARIASDPLDCVGVFCTSEDCYVHRARAQAEHADLVVVNHALLLADAAQGGTILPPYEHLIVDEAHHLEDAATSSLRQEVEGPGLLALLERLASSGPAGPSGLLSLVAAQPRLGAADADAAQAIPQAVSCQEGARALFSAAAQFVQGNLPELSRRDETLRITPALRGTEGWERLSQQAADRVTGLTSLDASLRRIVATGRDWLGGEEPDPELRELEIIRERIAEACQLLSEGFGAADPNRVYWLTLLARSFNLVLRSAPLNVGELMKEHVFGGRSTLIFTSASLALAGSFDYFRQRVGLEREPETLILASPFDYLRQALVCLPMGIPEPESEDFQPLLEEVIADLGRRLGGRTLVLFTSHSQLRDTYFALKQRADLDDVLLLGQGIDGQRRQVLRTFVSTAGALLLGTSSFWEGIDVPGDRLSCVVMVRLPFPVPSEPVFAARAELLRDPFASYALPLAALRLKQGFGRLIRRSSDRGAVVLLDSRITTRDYGRAFLQVLPPVSMFTGPVDEIGERIEGWIGGAAGGAT